MKCFSFLLAILTHGNEQHDVVTSITMDHHRSVIGGRQHKNNDNDCELAIP